MIFSKKEITICHTIEKCNSCNMQNQRKFKEGDILFSRVNSCSCGGDFYVELIYGETLKQ